ncbi:MAG: tripartite tricarboxylate transporter substrate binding protein [Spirochaetales bacterium]|nr:tripartite tricarboxylate transporter substrate binding protein [Spirochaetales bacterium]
MKKRLFASIMVVCVVSAAFASGESEGGASYPNRTVRVIIPWSVGGMTDVLTRPIAEHLEENFGVPFVVENRPGGGGVVGSLEIENSEGDGYIIGTTSMSTVSARYVAPVAPDINNVELIAQVISIPATVTVNADSPWTTLEELLEYARANPGELTNSNSGNGASAHIYALTFGARADVEMNHIPYPGYAEAVTALLAGNVDMTNTPLPDVAQYVDTGELRMLAIAAAERHPNYPDVPTLRELGVEAVMGNYSGFVAPEGTPEEYIATLETAIEAAVTDPEINEFLLGAGFQPVFADREAFATIVRDAEAQLEYLVNDLGIEFVDD